VLEAIADEGVRVRAGDDENRPAVAAVATARAAAGHAFLAPERETPATAVAGCDRDVYLVDEHAVAWVCAA
jgi:hypothetical protein